jgi:putative intracellular protease/amidase
MGGIWILPDLSLEELDPKDALLLVLPGGEGWLDESHALAIAKAAQFLSAGVIVAAICGATLGLGAAGLLDNRDHTSNDLGYMKAVCPAYRGETKYREEPAVFDGGLITASGIAPVEFAGLVLESLDLVDHDALDGWLGLYRSHESRYYFQLMESLPKMKSA